MWILKKKMIENLDRLVQFTILESVQHALIEGDAINLNCYQL